MSDKILYFECLISGFNYDLMKKSSVLSRKKAQIYSNAILIIASIWMGLGIGIGHLYGGASGYPAVALGVLFPLLIITFERIIVQTSNNFWTFFLRVVIALLISAVGSTLVTQILFSSDISKKQTAIRIKEREQVLTAQQKDIQDKIKGSQQIISGKDTIVVDVMQKNEDGSRKSIGKETDRARNNFLKAEQQNTQNLYNQLSGINKSLTEVEKTITEEMANAANQRSILDDISVMGEITSNRNADNKSVYFFFNNQADFFKSILFYLILAFELLVVLIKLATHNDEFDYQFNLAKCDELAIKKARHTFDDEFDKHQTQGSRDLAEKLLNKK